MSDQSEWPRRLAARAIAWPPAELIAQHNELARLRNLLLGEIRRAWVKGVLDRSLAELVRLDLTLVERSGAVTPRWETLLGLTEQPDRPFPLEAPIHEVAERFGGHLLILGEPGTGKTSVLLRRV